MVFKKDIKILWDRFNIIIIMGICAVLLIVSIWISTLSRISAEYQAEIAATMQNNATLARAFEEHVHQMLKNMDDLLLFLKQEYEVHGQVTPEMMRRLESAKNIAMIHVTITDEKGNVIASSQTSLLAKNFSERDFFQIERAVDDNQTHIARSILGDINTKCLLHLSKRLNRFDGSFAGTVLIAVDTEHFSQYYSLLELGKDYEIGLVGHDGFMRIQEPQESLDDAMKNSQCSILRKLRDAEVASYIDDGMTEQSSRIVSYRSMSDYPLIVVVSALKSEVLTNYYHWRKKYYWGAVIVSLVVLAIIALLIRMILQKLKLENFLLVTKRDLEERALQRNAELEDANKKMRKISKMDALTNLPNRAYLNEWLKEEMQRNWQGKSAGAVFFIDLDNLKLVNDTFGHTYGDALIIAAGKLIRDGMGKEAFVARIGGDEFISILSGISDRQYIEVIAERIVQTLSRGVQVLGMEFHISASIGIAIYPEDGDAVEEILKNADNAMYAAKNDGKNCWRFYKEAMQIEAYNKMLLINSLRYAVERDELLLHFQPQVDDKGITVGFEALLRWNSAEHGYISPAKFIPLAEENGIIQEMGKWVLQQACWFAKRLSDQGWNNIRVAINVSPCQLGTAEFVDSVRAAISSAGIETRQLEIEITENALMASMEDSICKLNALQLMGVHLALDDFGTGYSSLTYLTRLPVKTLKLDKAFIDMILVGGGHKEIIETIIKMAHSMGMSVVAEGVETKQQLDYLVQCGCDCIQGYIYSKPLPEDEAVRFLSSQIK